MPKRRNDTPVPSPLYPSFSLDLPPAEPQRNIEVSLFMIGEPFRQSNSTRFRLPVPQSWMKLINCNVPRVVYSDDYSKYFDLEPESSQPEPEPAKPPSTPLSTAADYPEELEPTNDVLPHLTPPKLGWKAQRAVMKARRSMPEPRHEPIEATESSDFVKEYIENHGDLYISQKETPSLPSIRRLWHSANLSPKRSKSGTKIQKDIYSPICMVMVAVDPLVWLVSIQGPSRRQVICYGEILPFKTHFLYSTRQRHLLRFPSLFNGGKWKPL